MRLGVPGIHLVNAVHCHPSDRIACGKRLRQLDLYGVHAGHVMHDDPDPAPVLGNTGLPLGIGQSACERGERAGSLLETFGKGVGTLAHGFGRKRTLRRS